MWSTCGCAAPGGTSARPVLGPRARTRGHRAARGAAAAELLPRSLARVQCEPVARRTALDESATQRIRNSESGSRGMNSFLIYEYTTRNIGIKDSNIIE